MRRGLLTVGKSKTLTTLGPTAADINSYTDSFNSNAKVSRSKATLIPVTGNVTKFGIRFNTAAAPTVTLVSLFFVSSNNYQVRSAVDIATLANTVYNEYSINLPVVLGDYLAIFYNTFVSIMVTGQSAGSDQTFGSSSKPAVNDTISLSQSVNWKLGFNAVLES